MRSSLRLAPALLAAIGVSATAFAESAPPSTTPPSAPASTTPPAPGAPPTTTAPSSPPTATPVFAPPSRPVDRFAPPEPLRPNARGRGEVPITFQGEQPGLTLLARHLEFDGWVYGRRWAHRRWAAVYDPICTAPCSILVPRGTYHLGVAGESDSVADYGPPVRLVGPTAIRAEYESHAGLRAAGVVTTIVSVVGGIGLMVDGIAGHHPSGCAACAREASTPEIIGGAGLLLVGSTAGIVMMSQRDEARLSFGSPPAARAMPDLHGVAFRSQF